MKFTKMQGLGNDYVYVNCLEETVADPSALAVAVSDRHFGIGSDGLILIKPSEEADFEMDMYNADGSRGLMCGNGIRCVGKYVYDYGLTEKKDLKIATGSGIRTLALETENGKVSDVTVDMGEPDFTGARIPAVIEGYNEDEILKEVPLEVDGRTWMVTCVSMGNPHCVTVLPPGSSPDDLDLEKTGPGFENHSAFPQRVNTEFIQVINSGEIRMRVWERGSGETFACGTGACAAAAACILRGLTGPSVRVELKGGALEVEWNGPGTTLWMKGPAVTVFEGEYFG